MGVEFEPCWSSGGYMSARRAEERSNITTKEELNRLECTPAFRAWLKRRGRSFGHQVDGNYLLGIFLLVIVLLSGAMIGIALGLGMERTAPAKQKESMKMDKVQPMVPDNTTVLVEGLRAEITQLREKVATLENQPKAPPAPFDFSKCPKKVCNCPKGPICDKEIGLEAVNSRLKLENAEMIIKLTDQSHKSEPMHKSHLCAIAFLGLLLGFLWRKNRVHIEDFHKIQRQNERLQRERDAARDEAAYALSCVRSSKLPTIQEGASMDEIKEKVEKATQEALEVQEKKNELQTLEAHIKDLKVETCEYDRICEQLARLKSTYEALQAKEKELVELTPVVESKRADIEMLQNQAKNLQMAIDAMPQAETIRQNVKDLEKEVTRMKTMNEKCDVWREALKGIQDVTIAHETLSVQYDKMEQIRKENSDLEEELRASTSDELDLRAKTKQVKEQKEMVRRLREELEKLEEEASALEVLVDKKQSLDEFCKDLCNLPQEVIELEAEVKQLEDLKVRHQKLTADLDQVNKLKAECKELELNTQELPSLSAYVEEARKKAKENEVLLNASLNASPDSQSVSHTEQTNSNNDQSGRTVAKKGKKKKKGKSGRSGPAGALQGVDGPSFPDGTEGDSSILVDNTLQTEVIQHGEGLENLLLEDSDERDQDLVLVRGHNELLKSENLELQEKCDNLKTLNQTLVKQVSDLRNQKQQLEEVLQEEATGSGTSGERDGAMQSRHRSLSASEEWKDGKDGPVPNLDTSEVKIGRLYETDSQLEHRLTVLKQLEPNYFASNCKTEKDTSEKEWAALGKLLSEKQSTGSQHLEDNDNHNLGGLADSMSCHEVLEGHIASALKIKKEIQDMEQKLEETNIDDLEKQHLALADKIRKIKEIRSAQESQLIKLPLIEEENDELKKNVANVTKMEEENESLMADDRYLDAVSKNHALKNRNKCFAEMMGGGESHQDSDTNGMVKFPQEGDAESIGEENSSHPYLEILSAQDFEDSAIAVLGGSVSPRCNEKNEESTMVTTDNALAVLVGEDDLEDEDDMPSRYDGLVEHLGSIPEEAGGEFSEDFIR